MTSAISLSLLLAIGCGVFWATRVNADCCRSPCEDSCVMYGHLCDDCTRTTPFCGLGGCNIFGCNCARGCRKGVGCWNCNCPIERKRRSVPEISDAEYRARSEENLERIMAQADRDQDGRLNKAEYERWVDQFHPIPESGRNYSVQVEFENIDLDRNGYLTIEEIDPK